MPTFLKPISTLAHHMPHKEICVSLFPGGLAFSQSLIMKILIPHMINGCFGELSGKKLVLLPCIIDDKKTCGGWKRKERCVCVCVHIYLPLCIFSKRRYKDLPDIILASYTCICMSIKFCSHALLYWKTCSNSKFSIWKLLSFPTVYKSARTICSLWSDTRKLNIEWSPTLWDT